MNDAHGLSQILKELDATLKLDRNDAVAVVHHFPSNIDPKRVSYAGKIFRARKLLGLSVAVDRDGLLEPAIEAFEALKREGQSPELGA